MSYPEFCLQTISAGDWWVEQDSPHACRGALVYTFINHFDQAPYTFTPVGRSQPTEHRHAVVEVAPLKIGERLKRDRLPVAGMPVHDDEVWAAHRAKKRPCIVFSQKSPLVEKTLTRGKPNYSTAPTMLVAPFYGANPTDKRLGFKEEFIQRVQHCTYPQFHWDMIPGSSTPESILRLDQLQPMGVAQSAYYPTGLMLSAEAMSLLEEMLFWLRMGGLPEDSDIIQYQKIVAENFK
ncbi:hypothetical protein [Saccharospirillum mangrovi]|uniref:hypothetical protein n=1 Tax=Saccharospirillum mangrovi TaxID=2161747 RepID=UPI000D39A2E1|nr:hypothetical protein [Saccharospirillum mangrovi]